MFPENEKNKHIIFETILFYVKGFVLFYLFYFRCETSNNSYANILYTQYANAFKRGIQNNIGVEREEAIRVAGGLIWPKEDTNEKEKFLLGRWTINNNVDDIANLWGLVRSEDDGESQL